MKYKLTLFYPMPLHSTPVRRPAKMGHRPKSGVLAVPRFVAPLFIAFSLFALKAFAAPVIEKGDVVAVCGDSLTEQKVYSVFIEDYLLMCQPAPEVKTLGCGWGGSTFPHFASHMGGDVMTFSPTVAVVCFGINDGNSNVLNDTIVRNYRAGLEKVIANFQRGHTRTIIVGSPAVVDSFYFKNSKHPDVTAAQFNETLGQMGAIAKEVAAAKGVVFADLHTPMMEAMAKAKAQLGERYPFSSENDGVHGGPNEHLVMAYAFLKAMGFDGHVGTIAYDDSTGQATATEGTGSSPRNLARSSSKAPATHSVSSTGPRMPISKTRRRNRNSPATGTMATRRSCRLFLSIRS